MCFSIDKREVAKGWSIVIAAILPSSERKIGSERKTSICGVGPSPDSIAKRGRKDHGGDLARAMLGTGVSERPSDRQSAGRQRKHQLLDRATAEFIVPQE